MSETPSENLPEALAAFRVASTHLVRKEKKSC